MSDWEATAAVRPRVATAPGALPVLLEEIVDDLLAKRAPATVALAGEHGTGKTTALRYLAARFAGESRLIVCDASDTPPARSVGVLVLAKPPADSPRPGTYQLSPWTDDDCLEYLLARYPARCASVLARCESLATSLGGHPAVCSAVLDVLAEHEDVEDADEAFAVVLDRTLGGRTRTQARRLALWLHTLPEPQRRTYHPRLRRLGGSEFVLIYLAAEHTLAILDRNTPTVALSPGLPYRVIHASSLLLRADAERLERLSAMVPRCDPSLLATLVSVLNATRVRYRPELPTKPRLARAHLSRIDLSGLHCDGADLYETTLTRADLRRAELDRCQARSANLTCADLTGAFLRDARLDRANLTRAKLQSAHLTRVGLVGANLTEAKLDDADLTGAEFVRCDFSRASLFAAHLLECQILDCELGGADLRHADLSQATFRAADLRTAQLTRATLRDAVFIDSNLEGLALPELAAPGVTFRDCYLTGARLSHADLREARFQECGLADIDLEGADLRGADFRNSTFHMGSSRGGLLFSATPSEGSRTGFYTDDSLDHTFKAPEDVRKANLRGADLRRANLIGVDFYLVDVRDATLQPAQVEWLRRCRAIL